MKIRHVLAVTAAGVILATTTAAHAAGPPYTVSVGSSSAAGKHSYTGAGTWSFKNNAGTVVTMNCNSVTGAGSVTSDTGVNPVASIASTTWSSCIFPGGPVTVTQSGTWNLTGTGTCSNATTGNETITNSIKNVSFGFALTANPATCSFKVTGQMNGSCNETTRQLVVNETGYTGNLTPF